MMVSDEDNRRNVDEDEELNGDFRCVFLFYLPTQLLLI
jgi:hypothetical protein